MCVPGCGKSTCWECTKGSPQICPEGPHYGGGQDGFFADYAVVPERAAILLPVGVSMEAGAVATDACMTAHHAVVDRGSVAREDTVLILGLGGLGFNALQICLSIGARCIVLDKRQTVLDTARNLGIASNDIIPPDITDVSQWVKDRDLVIDVAIDFIGMAETFKVAVESGKAPLTFLFPSNVSLTYDLPKVRKAGTIVIVGLLGINLSFATGTIVRRQLNIVGSYGGTISNITACLELIKDGALVPQIKKGNMQDFPTILDDLHNGRIQGRMVMLPDNVLLD
ncbi:hypothetical protein LTR84_007128 [Exophiala bonariae]|uniref:Alanine dehydrogenase/pyridine nucleotide transhydrogenase NAD(H)-binding domain-containing protein n=1 Tax=Exophiala bonariae TaxID=1690606 RepID=A0AAV9MZP8_9EURO|nr:hypothetical protein LTR84_007128 [Exophiala bonariae]